jgi:hypothetical protein
MIFCESRQIGDQGCCFHFVHGYHSFLRRFDAAGPPPWKTGFPTGPLHPQLHPAVLRVGAGPPFLFERDFFQVLPGYARADGEGSRGAAGSLIPGPTAFRYIMGGRSRDRRTAHPQHVARCAPGRCVWLGPPLSGPHSSNIFCPLLPGARPTALAAVDSLPVISPGLPPGPLYASGGQPLPLLHRFLPGGYAAPGPIDPRPGAAAPAGRLHKTAPRLVAQPGGRSSVRGMYTGRG